ncbi:flavin monoamine oxidase family protein [Schinkia azotoformans]|uniref:flavin monoamine oxidase family protein n=1 Tax=Schinkia azotoformans TaxID=1454 RepID=UPI002DBA0B9A|nr:NAD(P)/FAD-dependent oxidoreductase [Schinkia azotoformans]MEC1715143.1 NAD(P)/FAD-dependent oxidoreductase [Schinkia azotoformans]MEC1739807.1 NAD(P)/FAD-dependent oxidoreductase [Schinkia azotoformans]MEC1745568.1 NAD(P)/FAD-dependent oxidoreductase [Schinkia azotoformans]MEC1760049.1 NAD(P)/FAD-dependent oxidoreductase [Schinkia azotoformans]MEC1765068.1 NAD(P)/FAD-dependent oxidoreductase [Schinkia azotoformans]
MRDVIVVGGGLAGLSAAWYLRHRDVLLLESGNRVGGRVKSERRGPYWLNWGGHVYSGVNSATGELLSSVGVDAVPVPGTFTGLAMKGKLLLDGRVETYPFRVPMSWHSRFALMKAGLKVRKAVADYEKIVRQRPGEHYWTQQQRVYNFMNDQTFTDFVGKLPEDADALFRPTVSRSAGEPEQVSAGAGVGYFNLVWSKGDGAGLTRNIVGGPSTLTETIASSLGNRVQLGAQVYEVFHKNNSVIVRYIQNGKDYEVESRYVVLATQAPITSRIAKDIDSNMREALEKIVYGPYISAAFLTNETGPQIWDNVYAIAAPKRSFNVAFNMSNIVRHCEPFRQQGSSFMTFSPAKLARKLIDKSDSEVIATYLDDLNDIIPRFSDFVVESQVQRFPLGLAYCFPGRGKLQPYLTRPSGRIYLAGDYLGTFYTETAIKTGYIAAQDILSLIGTTPSKTLVETYA